MFVGLETANGFKIKQIIKPELTANSQPLLFYFIECSGAHSYVLGGHQGPQQTEVIACHFGSTLQWQYGAALRLHKVSEWKW